MCVMSVLTFTTPQQVIRITELPRGPRGRMCPKIGSALNAALRRTNSALHK